MANIIRSNQWLIQLDNSTSIVSDFIARYFSCAGAASTDSTSIFAFFQRFLMLSIALSDRAFLQKVKQELARIEDNHKKIIVQHITSPTRENFAQFVAKLRM